MWVITDSRCVSFKDVGKKTARFSSELSPAISRLIFSGQFGYQQRWTPWKGPNAGRQSFGNTRQEASRGSSDLCVDIILPLMPQIGQLGAKEESALFGRGRFALTRVAHPIVCIWITENWPILRPLYIVTWPNLADKRRPPTMALTAWKDTFCAPERSWKPRQTYQRMIRSAEKMCVLDYTTCCFK